MNKFSLISLTILDQFTMTLTKILNKITLIFNIIDYLYSWALFDPHVPLTIVIIIIVCLEFASAIVWAFD